MSCDMKALFARKVSVLSDSADQSWDSKDEVAVVFKRYYWNTNNNNIDEVLCSDTSTSKYRRTKRITRTPERFTHEAYNTRPKQTKKKRTKLSKRKIVPKRSEPIIKVIRPRSSSSTSSSGTDSDDERKFERRQIRSKKKASGKLMPNNLDQPSPSNIRLSSSQSDIDPVRVDKNITFESVGGLNRHIKALREMIVLPIAYPKFFEHYNVNPPSGVLFYGPPGTGKTLVARALCNECSKKGTKVSFFMRKGADCLSKWVGESERMLRLLFENAYRMRPSIIFFDEIDGLAPVRSSRQDQIHSSIVSTLLALMDGLEFRGEVVVIGATNRIDAIDPALRRPGRFDREFFFPLPDVSARRQILEIHTKDWNPPPALGFLDELAKKCVRHCGADLKAVCTEAALLALRRQYPDILESKEKMDIDFSSITITTRDFEKAMRKLVPAAKRGVMSPARELMPTIRPLLSRALDKAMDIISESLSHKALGIARASKSGCSHDDGSDNEDAGDPIYAESKSGSYMGYDNKPGRRPVPHRPRLLLCGEASQGQSTHLGPAVLHRLEGIPVYTLDLPALYAISSRTPEEACSQTFREALRAPPSILYIPHICQWWESIGEICRNTFLTQLHEVPPSVCMVLIVTSNKLYNHMPKQVKDMFSKAEVINMENPNESERRKYFKELFLFKAFLKPVSLDVRKTASQGSVGKMVTFCGQNYRKILRKVPAVKVGRSMGSHSKKKYVTIVYFVDESTGKHYTQEEVRRRSKPMAPSANQVDRLLDLCVEHTKEFTAEGLERLYSKLNNIVCKHRKDKQALYNDIESIITEH